MPMLGPFVQNCVDRCCDVLKRGHPVDPVNKAALFIIRQDRRRLGTIFGEPGADRLLIVVWTPLELVASANVAGAFDLRQLELVVIGRAAVRTAEATGNALDQRLLVDLQLDDMT